MRVICIDPNFAQAVGDQSQHKYDAGKVPNPVYNKVYTAIETSVDADGFMYYVLEELRWWGDHELAFDVRCFEVIDDAEESDVKVITDRAWERVKANLNLNA